MGRMANREAASSRSSWQRVRDAITARRMLAYILMPLLLLCAFASLIALNLLLRDLWGELAYAILVTGVALWALSQTQVVTRLFERLGVRPFTIRRAILWSTFALVALPVAGDRGWRGLLVLFAPLAALLLFRAIQALRTPADDEGYKPRAWPWAVAGMVLLLLLVQTVPPPAENDAEAGALPPAAEENEAHAQLARRVRPHLLFDRRETRFPLDIEDAARAGRISSCSGDECQGVRRAASLDRAANFVEIADFTGERGGGPGSAYYYHVVDKDRPNRIYVDYWWYFTRNPSPVGAAVGCGPGARWVGITCHDHPSDWEGVTVVLGPCPAGRQDCVRSGADLFAPLAVRYAQHEHLVSYAWQTLTELWRDYPDRKPARPLVFVARDSHASYPAPCSGGCKQYANYPLLNADLPVVDERRDEAPHDGRLEWNYNVTCTQEEDADSTADCLEPIPITAEGLAASWNAFRGRWGRQRCILAGAYCDTSRAPGSPAGQGRYRDPGRAGPWLCVDDRRPAEPLPELDECGDEVDPDTEIPT
jgi:hypothetical protein